MWIRLGRCAVIAFTAVLGTASLALAQAEPESPIGFAPGSRAAQAKAEANALKVPSPEKARSWLRKLTEEPHVAGTPADHATAVFVRDKLKEWGWQAEIVEYEVLLNYPLTRQHGQAPSLKLVKPTEQTLKVFEDAWAADKDSASLEAFPAFHGYGVSGDVSGQVVYANYGRPDDFKALEKLGIDVEDRIVLVRYGELFRGLKVREAQKRGAAGVLIYSDPADDGYARGDVYPTGPMRPPSALQRGSVQFLSLGPGDPSTPNGPSRKNAQRLTIHPQFGFPRLGDTMGGSLSAPGHEVNEADMMAWEKQAGMKREDYYPTIPSLPISYEAAKPILEALGGPNVPTGWQGALPFAYHAGPGPAEVEFRINMDYQIRTIWNVVATIKGSVEPDRWVLLGNHRDAWVYGAVDPGSGTAATMEMCRALGAAVKHGWKPRRTLMYASWDAEEYGLVGSTEWVEDHVQDLDSRGVLLLNVDSAVGGQNLALDGVPSLRDLVLDCASGVTDLRSGKSLREVWLAAERSRWASAAPVDLDESVWTGPGESGSVAHASARFVPQMSPLGSGSDYTAFLDHAGVPSVDIGFKGRYGVYHSIYDDFFWMEKFCDPEFISHAMAARLYTLVAMRAAGAEVVPLRFVPYGEALRSYVDDLRRQVERQARAAGPEASKPPLVFENLPNLIRAVRAFQEQAAALDRATAALTQRDGVDQATLSRVNDRLQRVERAFLHREGLPGRPWFKHTIYAPGLTTGYACWPMPGVRQAVLESDASLLKAQMPVLVRRIEAATDAMKASEEAARPAGGEAANGRR